MERLFEFRLPVLGAISLVLFAGLEASASAEPGAVEQWTESATLVAWPTLTLHDEVAVGGGTVAVLGDFSGYRRTAVFERDGAGNWFQNGALYPSHWQSPAEAVNVDGNGGLIAVGVPDAPVGAIEKAGTIFTFVRQADGSWLETARIHSPRPVPDGRLGYHFALDGGLLATKAEMGDPFDRGVEVHRRRCCGPDADWRYDDVLAFDAPMDLVDASQGVIVVISTWLTGSFIFTYEEIDGDWQWEPFLYVPVMLDIDSFELEQGILAAADSGVEIVRVFERDTAGDWAQVHEVEAEPWQAGGGISVAVGGGLVAVGFPGDDTHATDAGSIWLYGDRGADGWQPIASLRANEPQPGDQLGRVLAFDGRRLVSRQGERHVVYDLLPDRCDSDAHDDFDDGALGARWLLAGVGNANQIAVAEPGGVLELTADGATAFAGDDNAGFFYQEVSGDFRAEVTIDGAGMATGGAYRKAGLMVRSGLETDAVRLLAQLVPYWNGGEETHLQWVARLTEGGWGNVALATDTMGVPRTVRLAVERRGGEMAAQYSLDGGLTWIAPSAGAGGALLFPDLPESLLVGLDVVSNDISVTTTARFDDFTLCPLPACWRDDFEQPLIDDAWTLTGIGNANQVEVDVTGGVLELSADGATAFAGKDNAGFLYQEVSGDFRFEAQVDAAGMITGGAYRKAGLMVRSGLEPDAVRLIAQLLPSWNGGDERHLQWVARDRAGGWGNLAVADDVIGVARRLRLAIERRGDVLGVDYSLDGGRTWARPATGLGGSITIPGLPEALLVGLDVVSNDISVAATARFDGVELCELD